jgi:hypothetical protein
MALPFIVVPKQSDNRSGYSNSTHSYGHRRFTYRHRNWGISQRWLWYPGTRVSRTLLSYDIDTCTQFNISYLLGKPELSVYSQKLQMHLELMQHENTNHALEYLMLSSRTIRNDVVSFFSTNTLMDLSRFCTNNFVSHRKMRLLLIYRYDSFAQVLTRYRLNRTYIFYLHTVHEYEFGIHF